jgi:hypothetical protein
MDKEAARLERIRKVEEDRRNRIYDSKARIKGADATELDEQLKTKRQILEDEKMREVQMEQERQAALSQLDKLVRQREQMKRENLADAANWNYAKGVATKSPSKTVSYQSSSQDEPVGPSSLRHFDGEDPHYKERIHKQQQEMSGWAAQLQQEKAEKIKRELDVNRMYESRMSEIDKTLSQLQEEQNRQRQRILQQERDYNKAVAEHKRESHLHEHIKETLKNNEETSKPFVAETTATSPNGKVLPYAYRGLSPEQLRKYAEEQVHQAQEIAQSKARSQEEIRKMDQQTLAMNDVMMQRQRDYEAAKREQLRQIAEENMRLAEQAKQRNKPNMRDPAIAPNSILASFGTSAR